MRDHQLEYDDWIIEIAGRLVDGHASATEIRRLEEELTRNQESLHRYLRFVMVDAQLRLTDDALSAISPREGTELPSLSGELAAYDSSSSDESLPVSADHSVQAKSVPDKNALGKNVPGKNALATRRKPRWHTMVAGIGSIAVVLAAAVWWQAMLPQVYILRGVGSRFIDPDLVSNGRDIIGRQVGLTSGLIELSFRKASATVVVEAPARFRVEDEKTLRVDYGRITAHVIDGEQGLRVLTPEMDVLDLGTRFAVDVVAGRRSEVHVFEGKVEAGVAKSGERQLLRANEALRFDAGLEPEACDLRMESFVQSDELQQLAAGLRAGQAECAQRAFANLKADPALLAAFNFDNLESEKLIEVHGARQVQGRFPGSRALDFVDVDDRVHLDWNVAAPQFTLMTWVRLNNELKDSDYNSIFHTDGWQTPGQVHWMIKCAGSFGGEAYKGQMRFAIHRGWRDARGDTSERALAEQTVLNKLNRWIHLALTYDADASTVRFFLNGQLDTSVGLPESPVAVLGPAEIGNWSPNAGKPRRRLCGRMDDLLILSRVLSDAEVHTYYQATTPYR